MLTREIIENIALAHNFARSGVEKEIRENYPRQEVDEHHAEILALTYDERTRPGYRLNKALEYFRVAERNNYRVSYSTRNIAIGVTDKNSFENLNYFIGPPFPSLKQYLLGVGRSFVQGNNFDEFSSYNSVPGLSLNYANTEGQQCSLDIFPYKESCFLSSIDGSIHFFPNYTYQDFFSRVTRRILTGQHIDFTGQATDKFSVVCYRLTNFGSFAVHPDSFQDSDDKYTRFFSQLTKALLNKASLRITQEDDCVKYYCSEVGEFIDRLDIIPDEVLPYDAVTENTLEPSLKDVIDRR